MKKMTTHTRMTRIYEHKEADRVPITDQMWDSTIARWKGEGLPDIDVEDMQKYLGMDRIITIGLSDLDTTPKFKSRIIEETDTYIIDYDAWGVTKKNFKPISATFQHLDHEIKDPATWQKAKERMTPSSDRINWSRLQKNYRAWREEGAWIRVAPWFGYDVVNARMCNTETILIAMADNPEWVIDMFNHGCDLTLALLDLMWEKGYTFDEFMWFDDMAYKNGMLFSKTMWKECLMPYQKRVIDWAHQHGIKSHLHCCGNINTLIPDLIDLGVDMINPMEVKAGMDPVAVKQQYGKELALMGGFDVRNWHKPELVKEEISKILPAMKEEGGYLFASDHSVPDNISLENYKYIIKLVKEIGKY